MIVMWKELVKMQALFMFSSFYGGISYGHLNFQKNFLENSVLNNMLYCQKSSKNT